MKRQKLIDIATTLENMASEKAKEFDSILNGEYSHGEAMKNLGYRNALWDAIRVLLKVYHDENE